jgi:hypothetical protein
MPACQAMVVFQQKSVMTTINPVSKSEIRKIYIYRGSMLWVWLITGGCQMQDKEVHATLPRLRHEDGDDD